MIDGIEVLLFVFCELVFEFNVKEVSSVASCISKFKSAHKVTKYLPFYIFMFDFYYY